MDKKFIITYITREDLADLGFDTSSITDEQMQEMAGSMATQYVSYRSNFWEEAEGYAIEVLKLKQNEI